MVMEEPITIFLFFLERQRPQSTVTAGQVFSNAITFMRCTKI